MQNSVVRLDASSIQLALEIALGLAKRVRVSCSNYITLENESGYRKDG